MLLARPSKPVAPAPPPSPAAPAIPAPAAPPDAGDAVPITAVPEAMAGADTPAPRTMRAILRLLDQVAPEPARAADLQARLNQAIPESAGPREQANALHARADAALEAGAIGRQLQDLRRAKSLGGGTNPERVMIELAAVEWLGGNWPTALDYHQRIRSSAEGMGKKISQASNLAMCYEALGDLPAAQKALEDAESIHRSPAATGGKKHGWGKQVNAMEMPMWLCRLDGAQGTVFQAQGQLELAEKFFSRARAEAVQAEKVAAELRASVDESAQDTYRNQVDGFETTLALNLMLQGRLEDAELAQINVLKRTLARHGRNSFNAGQALAALARIYNEAGRCADAEHLARLAGNLMVQAGVAPESFALALARRAHGEALAAAGRWQEADREFRLAREGLAGATLGWNPPATGDLHWALAQLRTGQAEAAARMLEPMVAWSRQYVGEDHYLTAERRGFLALALAGLGQRRKALDEFRASCKVLLARDAGTPGRGRETPGRILRQDWIMEGYIGLLLDLHREGQDAQVGVDAVAEAFGLADRVRGGSVDRAVAASAARAALKDARLAEPVRQAQDLEAQVAAAYQELADAFSAEDSTPAAIEAARRRLGQLAEQQKDLARRIARSYPDYEDRIHPRQPSIAEARAALAPGETLLSLLVGWDRTYIWALGRQGPALFTAAPLGAREIDALVANLRRTVEPGQRLADLPAFDLEDASRLYQELLAPAADVWQGSGTLLVSANGSLAQLPLALLPTRPVTVHPDPRLPFAEYRDVPWLARQAAVVQVPSVNSLVRLRAMPPGKAARLTFLGFGDPQFDRLAALKPGVPGPQLRNLAIIHVGAGGKEQQAPSAEDWIPYSAIPPLPDTREEILAIARTLGADPARDVFLGSQASKKTLASLALEQRRIIAFATHGLVPGDFPGLEEPALALAAPDNPAENGFLTLSEILNLKLDADWVVLSACNTAAGAGMGAEALSGLGRGFFYAGSRSLLATHWPVETVSARLLMTGTFRRYGAGGVTRAESLRQAMLELMSGQYVDPATGKPLFSYAHPIFWAPYELAGDGGGTLAR